MSYIYQQKPNEKLKADFSRRKQKNLNSFNDLDDFLNWYESQSKVCFYCGIKEEELQEVVLTSKLTSNRFPLNGKTGQGRGRGIWLEVDRLNPKENYSRKNCVLCCYFCNNDKSDVFDSSSYKSFMKNRAEFLRQLIKK